MQNFIVFVFDFLNRKTDSFSLSVFLFNDIIWNVYNKPNDLTYDTRALNTLHQISLTEQIHNHQRYNNHQAASVIDRSIVERLSGVCRFQRFRDSDNIRHQRNLIGREKHLGVKIVRPLPRKRKQENRNHHRDRQRQNDLQKCSERSRAVDIRTFLQFVRHAAEELPHHKDV